MNQAAEQIIFVDNPDDTITAVIQIQYVGPSKKFAWVIPMPGKPTIGVSSNVAFQRLDAATSPQYSLEQIVEGTCMPDTYYRGGDFANGTSGAADAGIATPNSESVMVLDQGSVGPYDYVVISLDPKLADPADVAIQWFMTEGYDLTGVDGDLLGPYLADGLNLLAFKLTKGNEAGAIRPVVLTYQSELPMIPLRPTSVAAQDDMGIKVWVAADKQAVPKNYKSLVLNEALINWFNFQQNYDQVVTAAANEAGGQGFVTELAGPTEQYTEQVFSAADEANWQQLTSQTYTDGIAAIFAANNYYRDWDGWRETIEKSVTLPAGVTIDDFGRSPEQYRDSVTVDTAKFFSELEDNLITPARDTQKMLQSRPYLTRLYSTMSADEMTLDPAFTYNADLADVSNVHQAKQFIMCNPSIAQYDAPWRIELPQGGVLLGQGGGGWPIEANALPANLKIVQLSTTGSGEVVTDNRGTISTELFQLTDMPQNPGAGTTPSNKMATIGGDQTLPSMSAKGGSDCSVEAPGGGRAAQGLWALPLLGLVLGLRRGRRSSKVRT